MVEAEALMRAGEVDAIVRVPVDFSRRLAASDARLQLVLNGVDTGTANTLEGYVSGAVSQSMLREADCAGGKANAAARVKSCSACGSTKPATAPGIWFRAWSCSF
jgi:ABC-2 type transport system permease protein